MTPGRRQPQDDLEAVIDQPLERGQGSNHADPDRQTVPETFESDVAVDSRHGFSCALASYDFTSARASVSGPQIGWETRTLPVSVQLADHHVRWVTDDRTSDTGNVSAQETHPGLLQRVVALLWLAQRRVDVIDRRLKGRELDHRVGDLPAPERVETLV